nr:L-threonylcarbamoyladenylate synthase [Actinomycetota bacterium]
PRGGGDAPRPRRPRAGHGRERALTPEDVERFERALRAGGVGLFPADTVYGLAADPLNAAAARRIYEIKGRDLGKPMALMFFDLDRALAELRGVGPRTRAALERLLPGAVTVIVPDATGERIGARVPRLTGELAPLAAMGMPVLQSSANIAGARDPRALGEVDPDVRGAVDAELDGGELPGTPSTVVDLTQYESHGTHAILREGAVDAAELAERL